ncbi:MAG: dehydrogenase with different specificity (related to short-chain alcohol dehydrogenase)-like [Microbacteriaceae bacterium]|nr:dehydrogenase with different specificity (related to short-chain alcohol dehydrogenase)-like [Microbacteriaceae bacterium]
MADSGRTFLVTGGTGGLGGAIASAFSDEPGATVIVTGATQGEVDAGRADPRLSKARVELLDVRDDAAVHALIGSLERLDVLVNAAGVSSSPADFTPEGFARTIDINLNGTARACFAAKDLLQASKGNIINFASVQSFRGTGTGPAYAASKGGVMLLTSSLAIGWGPDIRVNAIAPGFMDTPMTQNLINDAVRSKKILDHTPAGRWGVPDDLVPGAKFLASTESSFVTGHTLPIDGGYLTT